MVTAALTGLLGVMPGSRGAGADALPPFELPNWDGQVITADSFPGSRTIVLFTYAKCDMACPMATQALQELDQELGKPEDLRLIHISVNPTEDSCEEILKHFAKFGIDPRLDPRWLFLRGTPEQTAAVLTRYGIEVSRTPIPTVGMLIRHTVKVLVFEPMDETLQVFDTYQWMEEEMHDALQ